MKTNFVNSARLTFTGAASGSLSGALLALDRSDVPAGLLNPIGAWNFSGGSFGTATLNFRYDHAASATAGRPKSELKVFQYRDGIWVNVTAGPVNTLGKTINTQPLTALGPFAIGWAPRGTTIMIL